MKTDFRHLRFAALLLMAFAPAASGAWAQDHSDAADHGSLASGATMARMNCTVPDIKLVRADGKTISLPEELNDGRPVVMSFIFTTCTTICPLSSQTFERLETLLGKDRNRVHMVSISIDPEEDTPARLTAYAKKYKAGPNWSFYTGTLQESLAAQRAFGAYRGDKMDHTPLTLIRLAQGQPWIRIDGFATPEELYNLVRENSGSR